MKKLTLAQEKLLRYPPTRGTWLCQVKRGEEQVVCGLANSASAGECWGCRTSKPRRPKLVWPTYEALCNRVGHTPGVRWPVPPPPSGPVKTKGRKR